MSGIEGLCPYQNERYSIPQTPRRYTAHGMSNTVVTQTTLALYQCLHFSWNETNAKCIALTAVKEKQERQMSACCGNKHTSSSLFGIVQASRLQSLLYSGNKIYDAGMRTT